jgi:chromosomal replication initiation ATPase DnaA
VYTQRKITHKYNTIEQTRFIYSFLFERKEILSVRAIEKVTGLFRHELSDLLYNATISLNPESIKKLIPVLETVGFKMPVLSFTIEEIQRKICELSGLSLFVLKSKTTKRDIVENRQIAIYFCKILTDEKNKSIAPQFNCSVSNVTQTINKVKEWYITNKHIREKIDKYKLELTKFV